jgi:hypothetical protein
MGQNDGDCEQRASIVYWSQKFHCGRKAWLLLVEEHVADETECKRTTLLGWVNPVSSWEEEDVGWSSDQPTGTGFVTSNTCGRIRLSMRLSQSS